MNNPAGQPGSSAPETLQPTTGMVTVTESSTSSSMAPLTMPQQESSAFQITVPQNTFGLDYSGFSDRLQVSKPSLLQQPAPQTPTAEQRPQTMTEQPERVRQQPSPTMPSPFTPAVPNGLGHGAGRPREALDRGEIPQPKRRKTYNENDTVMMSSSPPASTNGALMRPIMPPPPPPPPPPLRRQTMDDVIMLSPKANQVMNNTAAAGVVMSQASPSAAVIMANPSADVIMVTSAPKPSETIDLTGGDSEPAKPTNDPSKDEEVCYGMIEGATINCHKVPAPKQGMIAINGPDWWPQIKAILRRKADDRNTSRIFVYDCNRVVFGLVDQRTADCLAPLLDSALQIRTDCRIPSRRKLPGEQVGQQCSVNLKLELMVYGPRKYAQHVGRHFANRNVLLVSPPRVDPGIKVFNPMAKENRLPQAARSNNNIPPSGPAYPTPTVIRSAEEIRNEVMGVFDTLNNCNELPEMDPDPRVQTELLHHQKQALYFMTRREEDELPDAGTDGERITTIWQKKRDRQGRDCWYNVVTCQAQREKPPPTRGGLLADMMGLGKTLSILSLVTKTLEEADRWSRQPPVQPQAPKQRTNNKQQQNSHHAQFDVPKPAAFDLTPVRLNGKATLLICPLSTVTNWEEQIKQHIKADSIRYHIYHGPNRVKDVEELARYDLVITTYGSIVSELNSRIKGKRGIYPLEEIAWFRIVLDEAHTIREQSTLAFKSVCRLQASRRWAVTGTPVQNKLDDLASLLAFLRLKPFDDRSKFLQHIIQPFKVADPEVLTKLRVLIDTITLRRLKDKISLPERTDEIVYLDFTPEERRIYDWFARSAQERVKILTGNVLNQDRLVGGKTMIHILRSILQLRLICAHGKDLLSDEDLEQLQGMTADTPIDLDSDDEDKTPVLSENKAYEMFYLMVETGSDNCFRCNIKLGSVEVDDPESDRQDDVLGYMAKCFHVYCPSCIKLLRADQYHPTAAECTVCARYDRTAYVELHRNRADQVHESRTAAKNPKGPYSSTDASTSNNSNNNTAIPNKIIPDDRYSGPHTKTRALIAELLHNKALSEANPSEPPLKSVVFSGWTSHLDLIQIALDNAGITYTRLDGKMSRPARNAAMDAFRDDPSVQVILVSIMAGGLGLNLTAGNSVYVMEPQFNPAAEAQAIDRVHRLGQKRRVRTVRFIMRDSFEEKMLQLQEKKKKLASLSMDRDPKLAVDRTEAARQRLLDLRSLFK